MAYGLSIQNTAGGVMFDSRRQMSSMVLVEHGTQTGVTDYQAGDWVFVKGPADSNNVVFVDRDTTASTLDFKKRPTTTLSTTANDTAALCDYFVLRQSKDIPPEAGDNYGLLVLNPDGSTQFDSRSVQSDKHYNITGVTQPFTAIANYLQVGLTDEYCRMDFWSTGTPLARARCYGCLFEANSFDVLIYLRGRTQDLYRYNPAILSAKLI